MTPWNAFYVAAACYALFRFLLLPLSQALWNKAPIEAKLRNAPIVAALEKLTQVALIASLVYGGLAILVVVTGGMSMSVEAISASMASLTVLSDWLKTITAAFNGLLFLLVFVIFAAFAWRVMRRDVIDNLVTGLRERAEALRRAGEWPEIDITPEMQEILARLQERHGILESFDAQGPNAEVIVAAIRKEIERLETSYILLDLERRIDLAWQRPLDGRWTSLDRIKRVLFSAGTFSRLKLAGRMLSHAATVALCASLIAFKVPGLIASLEGRYLQLDDLRISVAKADAEAALRKARSAPPASETTASTPAERHVLQQIASDYRQTFTRAWSAPAPATSEDATERAARTRLVLRERAFSEHDRAASNLAPSGLSDDELSSLRDYARSTTSPDDSRSAIEHRAVSESEREGLHTEPRVRAEAEKPAQPRFVAATTLQEFELEQVLGTLVDAAAGSLADTEVGQLLLKRGASEYLKKKVVDVFRAGLASYLQIYLRTGVRDPAQSAALTTLTSIISPELRAQVLGLTAPVRLADKLTRTQHYPNREAKTIEPVERELERVPPTARRGREIELVDTVSSFDSQFPQESAERSARERLLEKWDTKDPDPLATRKDRATNFEALRRYSGSGGILIGKPIAAGPTLQLDDLTWRHGDNGYALTLGRDADGRARELALGPFRGDLINQALAYAADGRPVATTILYSPVLGRDRVLLHPAFLDTPLGSRLVAADQWIFDYTDPPAAGATSRVRQALQEVSAALVTYQAAARWLTEARSANARRAAALPKDLQTEIFAGVRILRQAADSRVSETLLTVIARCVGVTTFLTCVGDDADVKKAVEDKKITVPRHAFVSQIYERTPSTDNLATLLDPPGSDPLWPLTFTVQAVIDDETAIEFPGFQSYGPPIVLDGLTRDARMGDLHELRQLCLLQRLFRAALESRLGPRFPVERLVHLQAETAAAVPPGVTTPRLLTRQGRGMDPASYPKRAQALWTSYQQRFPASSAVPAGMASCITSLANGQPTDSSQCTWAAWDKNLTSTCRSQLTARRKDGSMEPVETLIEREPSCELILLAHLGEADHRVRAIRGHLGMTH